MVPSRWKPPSVSFHCHTNDSGGVPRWMQSRRWTVASTCSLAPWRSSASAPSAALARRSRADWRRIVLRSRFICPVLLELFVSGIATFGTRPCLTTSATNMFHCPPSSAGVASRCATVRSSTSRSDVAMTDSSQWLAFSNLSQKSRWFCENSKSLTLSFSRALARSRLVPAKSQQRPLFSWEVAVQSSRRFETEWSMPVTTRRSSAISSTDVVVTAFWSIRAVGSASNAFVRRSTRSGARSRGMGHSFELLGIPASYAAPPAPTRSRPTRVSARPHSSERPATRVAAGRSHALGDDLDRHRCGVRLRGSPDLVGGEGARDERRVVPELDDRPRRRLTGHGLQRPLWQAVLEALAPAALGTPVGVDDPLAEGGDDRDAGSRRPVGQQRCVVAAVEAQVLRRHGRGRPPCSSRAWFPRPHPVRGQRAVKAMIAAEAASWPDAAAATTEAIGIG